MNDTWEKKEKKKKNVVSSSISRAYIFSFSPQSKVVCLIFTSDNRLKMGSWNPMHRASIRTLLSLVERQADADVKCKFCFYIIYF